MSELVDAVKNGDLVRVHKLAQQGENIDLDPDDQGSPLHWAVCLGHTDIVNCLLQAGAVVNITTPWGMTPLHVAADMGNTTCVSLLLQNGAEVDAQSNHRDTPLHAAAQRGFLEACRMLLKFGANISLTNKSGKTPVEEAKGQGHSHVASLLVKYGRADGKNHTDTLYIGHPKLQADERSVTTPFYRSQFPTDSSTMPPLPVTSDTKRRDSSFHKHSVMAKRHEANGAEGSKMKSQENPLSKTNLKGDTMTCKIMTDDGKIEEKVLNIPVSPTGSLLSHRDAPVSPTGSILSHRDAPAHKDFYTDKSQNGSYDVHSLGHQHKNHVKHESSKPFSKSERTMFPHKGLDGDQGKVGKKRDGIKDDEVGYHVSSRPQVSQQTKKEVDLQHQVMLLMKQRNMLEEYVEKLQIELTKRQDRIDDLQGQAKGKGGPQSEALYSQYVSLLGELAKEKQESKSNHTKMVSLEGDLKTCQKRLEVEIARSRHLAIQLFDLRKKLDENPSVYKYLMVAQASQTVKKLPRLQNKYGLSESEQGKRQTQGLNSGLGSGHGGRFVGRGLDSPEPSSSPPRPGSSHGASGQSAPDLLAIQFAALGMGGQCTHENLYSALLPIFQCTGGDLLGMIMASLQSKVKETLVLDKNPLQNLEREWIFGEDYVLMDDSPLPESHKNNAAFFRVIHKDKLYILKVLVDRESLSQRESVSHSFSLPNLSSTSSHDCVLQMSPHRNITRILHHYCGSLEPLLQHLPPHSLQLPRLPGQQGAITVFYVTDVYPMTMGHLIKEYNDLNSEPPYGLPHKFIYQIVYEILSGLCHLEAAGHIHGAVRPANVFLDDKMQVILGGVDFERKIIGSAAVAQEPYVHSNDTLDAAQMMCTLFQSQNEAKAAGDDVCCIPSCFPALLRHVIQSLLKHSREERITTRQAKIRIGIGLFGPGASEVSDLKQCEVWLQAKMMKLLVQSPPSTRLLPEGTMASVEISVELNHDWLERDFVTMVTPKELWEQYCVVREYIPK